MGIAATSAHRYYKSHDTSKVQITQFDRLLVGTASTYPDDNTYVTDSAAGATALLTGHKTYNNAIAVSTKEQPLDSLFKKAKRLGYNTGLVATSEINHATPATCYAHNGSRHNYDAIADDFLDRQFQGKPLIDLAFGGGLDYFTRSERNLLDELKQLDYSTLQQLSELEQVNSLPAIGLFAPVGMPYAIDESPGQKNRLTQMTQKALELLGQEKEPFVLLVEGSLIDWCEHDNDVACLMAEMEDFEQTLSLVKQFAEQQGDTLVIATADHATGGLSVGGYDKKKWKPEVIAQVQSSIRTIVSQLLTSTTDNIQQIWPQHVDFALTEEELKRLQEARQQALTFQGEDAREKQEYHLANAVRAIINRRSYTGWTSLTHTADDVPVMAYGPGADLFRGHQDNVEIGQTLFNLLKQREQVAEKVIIHHMQLGQVK